MAPRTCVVRRTVRPETKMHSATARGADHKAQAVVPRRTAQWFVAPAYARQVLDALPCLQGILHDAEKGTLNCAESR
jgi:hypothetical protein